MYGVITKPLPILKEVVEKDKTYYHCKDGYTFKINIKSDPRNDLELGWVVDYTVNDDLDLLTGNLEEYDRLEDCCKYKEILYCDMN